MNFRRIECFLAVVDAGTVTAAAAQLHVAQPALSRQIKTLERELKLALFEPQGSRLGLTSAGRVLVAPARRLMADARSFDAAAATLRTGRIEERAGGPVLVRDNQLRAPILIFASCRLSSIHRMKWCGAVRRRTTARSSGVGCRDGVVVGRAVGH